MRLYCAVDEEPCEGPCATKHRSGCPAVFRPNWRRDGARFKAQKMSRRQMKKAAKLKRRFDSF